MVSIETAIRNSEASLQMEGFELSDEISKECRRVLTGEITHEEYIARIKRKYHKISEDKNGGLQS
ncbi:hypothetical protein FACS1894219_12510 [Clostridia bacterium]|nr:hypothetical protein FACS1894219_12510 [Clostridia bacterium]